MTSRREFLQIGIAAASTWPLASQVARASGIATQTTGALPLYKVVYDKRFPQSVSFAQRAQHLGVATHAIEGDMTSFWYDDVYHRWKQGPVAIAGLTAHGPMFCFEQLAMDQRMRVVFRAAHRPAVAGCVDHELTGPVGMLRDARDAIGRSDWAAHMAELITQCPRGRTEIVSATGRSAAQNAVPVHAESLYSWVIAPAARA
jgi:hypothetical protein